MIQELGISTFKNLESRNDKGALWENFLIVERLKMNSTLNIDAKTYFWQTSQQQEIDYIEEFEGKLRAYEFTYKDKRKLFSKTFLDAYKPTETLLVNKDNYDSFLGLYNYLSS